MAQYLGVISGLTGWSRDFILWQLPLSQGLQMQHVALLQQGIATVRSDQSLIEELSQMVEELANGGTESPA